MKILVLKFSLTTKGENKFADFINLESLTYSGYYIDISNILLALGKFNKNVKELNLVSCTFNVNSLNSIGLHENLINLKLNTMTMENKKKIVDLIINLLNLKEIEILGSDTRDMNYSFFKKIHDAKINRGDKNVLKIYIDSHDYEHFNKDFSLISINYFIE